WGRFVWRPALLAFAIMLGSCQENPLAVSLPGTQWVLDSAAVDIAEVSRLTRTPSHGGSRTLYAGQSEETDFREVGILLKFSFPKADTTILENLLSARLTLILRVFDDDPPGPGTSFDLHAVDAPDTAWAESDTALTLADFPQLTFQAMASPGEDTVVVRIGSVVMDTLLQQISFPVDTLLLRQWAAAVTPNNGFLIREGSGAGLISCYSWENFAFSPYLALTLADTTSEGADTAVVLYRFSAGDLSIYPSAMPPSPVIEPLPPGDRSIQLNHSYGLRSFLDLEPDFAPDSAKVVAGARLILRVRPDASRVRAAQVVLQLSRRVTADAEGATAPLLDFAYSAGSDSAILNLTGFMGPLSIGSQQNHGLELAVIPRANDFDHLTFWGPDADEGLRPRVEIIYAQPYVVPVP
ncbi:MAG: hypothetical protein V3U35_03705, partial [Candidatus Neomarinimicrobiota bacterium]